MSENGSGADFVMPVVMTVAALGTFLVEHGDMLEAIVDAFRMGRTKAEILAGIRAGMVTAADAAVTADLGPRP